MKIFVLILFQLLTLLNAFDENFKPNVTLNGEIIDIEIKIAEGIHLNREGLEFSLNVDNSIAEFGDYIIPKGEIDSFGGEVYSYNFKIQIPLILKKRKDDIKELIFTLKYQGCSDAGVCFRPETKEFVLIGGKKTSNAQDDVSEVDSIAKSLKSESFIITLLTFLGFGLLLALTPCIFPLIPILSSIIVSQGEGMSAKRGFLLSLVYVIAMSLAYSLAGVIAAIFGANIQVAMQNPIVITIFSLIFIALALSLFGFYDIKLPEVIQNRLTSKSDEAGKRGGFIGVAIMGFLSALIVGPCVAPPLAGAIIYIGQTGDVVLGGASLFVMSLGMGTPLLLIGLGAGKFMPKPGGWMNGVSRVFGVIMLGIAIDSLSKILPTNITMLLWATLIIISSIYMGALEPLKERFGFGAFIKGLAVILLFYGFLVFIGGLTGATTPLKPLERFTSTDGVASAEKREGGLEFTQIKSLDELDEVLFQSDKVVMVDFTAKWCVSCKEWEEITFKDKRVKDALQSFDIYQIDVTDNSEEQKSIMKEFDIVGPPAILFFKYGVEMENKRIYGFKNPEEFIKHINNIEK